MLEKTIEEINDIIANSDIQKYFFYLNDSSAEIIDFLDDPQEISDLFYQAIQSYLNAIQGYPLLSIKDVDERMDAIYYLDNYDVEVPLVKTILNKCGDTQKNYDDDDFLNIKFLISKCIYENKDLVFFKIVYPMQTIYKKNAVRTKNRKYQKMEHNSFRIPQDFDFFIYNEILFINHIDKFERAFSASLVEFRKREAQRIIRSLKENNFIQAKTGDQLLGYIVEDSNLAKRFLKVENRLNSSSEKINENQIVSFIKKNFSGYGIIDLKNEIQLTSKKKVMEFINIISDDLFISELTGNKYEVKASNLLPK